MRLNGTRPIAELASRSAVHFPSIAWNNVNCDFRQDESWNNPAVSNLQWTLNVCYGPDATYPNSHRYVTHSLTTEGKYGPRTREAVRQFQRWYNANNAPIESDLTVDGYAGPTTRSKMLWVTNGLYGPKCSSVNKNPPLAPSIGGASRALFGAPVACTWGQGEVNPVYLNGYLVRLLTSKCNGAILAQAFNTPEGSVLSIDRTNFESPDDEGAGACDPCWRSSADLQAEGHSSQPFYHYWDASVRQGTTLVTPGIDGNRHYVRACLAVPGKHYQCSNLWYADTDDGPED